MKVSGFLYGLVGGLAIAGAAFVATGAAGNAPAMSTKTPVELVATYESIADVILATHKAERDLVRSILVTTYGHAQAVAEQTKAAMKAGDTDSTKKGLQNLAELVAYLGTEGDNSVGRVRKRLLEGGHHANAEGEKQGIFEEGYVVVTRTAKKSFLDVAQAIGQLATKTPTAEALDELWKKVDATYAEIAKAKK